MTPILGTKLDTPITSRARGIYLAARRAAVLALGLGAVSVTSANDALSGLPDPTRPSYVSVTTAGAKVPWIGPELQSTFISTSRRRAVISGRSYKVGDKFGGGIITEIQPYEVVWKQAGREKRLRLLPRLAKQMSFVTVPADSLEGRKK
ncbi:MAG: hypothetical protein ACYC9L_07840 [Sulfuricaulis sp.]